jgi:hypothetical protein
VLKVDCSKSKRPIAIKIRPAVASKTATEEYFQSIYLNSRAEELSDVIIFHRPLFESLATGIVCLKSLRLENCLGLVLQAPKSILKTFSNKILEQDKNNELSQRPVGEIFEKLKNEALLSGIAIVYEQRPDLSETKSAIDLSRGNPRPWAPTLVHKKIAEIVPIINKKLEGIGIFLWPTVEYTDDVPILRVLTGPKDPYTAERLGSFAFFSTQRGMEWYSKQFGKTDFEPHKGHVFVTYFCDIDQKETKECQLSINSSPEEWVAELLRCMKMINTKENKRQIKAIYSAFKVAKIRNSEINISKKGGITEIFIAAPKEKISCLKNLLKGAVLENSCGGLRARILNKI